MNAPVLVCFAAPQEAKPFRALTRARGGITVLVTGMGARNAEQATRNALEALRPGTVFTSGFAGALVPELRVGDVVFETAEARLAEKLREAGASPVRFCSSPRVAVTRSEKAALGVMHHAAAVEMESAVIQELCATRGIPCATVRAVSDAAGEDLPLDFNTCFTSQKDFSYVRLMLAVLRAPQKVPALLRLGRNSSFAARQLARTLVTVIGR